MLLKFGQQITYKENEKQSKRKRKEEEKKENRAFNTCTLRFESKVLNWAQNSRKLYQKYKSATGLWVGWGITLATTI